MPTPQASEAYAAWHDAKRALDAALPWTAEWLRLRLIEQELRSEWERLALDHEPVHAGGVRPEIEHDPTTVGDATRGGPTH